jgi:MFS transporter, putative metabolite:H+ symporter
MWLLNLPTGLILIALAGFLPESARFLQHMGRLAEARAVLARFGAVVVAKGAASESAHIALPPAAGGYRGATIALTLVALAWGLVNFGVLLWLPTALVEEGESVESASTIIAQASMLALPIVFACTLLYSRWSTKWTLVLATGVMSSGLALVLARGAGVAWLASPAVSTLLLIVGSTGVISILLPYTAESYPLAVRGRASGWIAGCSKLGGLAAQGLSLLVGAPPLGVAAAIVIAPALAAMLLIGRFGHETRGRDLRDLERAPPLSTRLLPGVSRPGI